MAWRRFTWIEWNLQKIDAHALSAGEVEAAFDRVLSLRERRDGSYQMFAEVPSVRRSPQRRARDEEVASEPPIPPPDLRAFPVEAHLPTPRRPLAVAGVVENGLARPLDPDVKLPERSRVIIVASEK